MSPDANSPSEITCLVLDIDGVMTDGTTAVRPAVEKRLYLRDLDAIGVLKRAGLKIGFLTGEPEAEAAAVVERCGGDAAVYDAKDKAAGLSELLAKLDESAESVCFVGDAERDVPALRGVSLALVPADASEAARSAADVVLSAPGGRGVVEEAAALILGESDSDATQPRNSHHLASEVGSAQKALAEFHDRVIGQVAELAEILRCRLGRGATLFLFGNGGSAVMSQHAAAELIGRFRRERDPIRAVCLNTDTAVLTSLANDYGYEIAFDRQIRALGRPGDVALAMSTSGTSENVLVALRSSQRLGMLSILFTGEHEIDESSVDFCLKMPSEDTARIQELHLLSWHLICDLLEQRHPKGGDGDERLAASDSPAQCPGEAP